MQMEILKMQTDFLNDILKIRIDSIRNNSE